MNIRGIQTNTYKQLLESQAQDDAVRQAKIDELRRKQIRETIKRKREEQELRERQANEAKARRAVEKRQAQLDAEEAERKRVQCLEEVKRKQPLSADEAHERREKAEAARNAKGLAQLRQELPPQRPTISKSYSSLLANAPTKLNPLPSRLSKDASPHSDRPEKTVTPPIKRSIVSPAKRSTPQSISTARSSPPKPSSSRLDSASRASPSVSRNTSAVSKVLPAGGQDLQPLQKTKRDLRTIEEIQNDLHRRMGKDYAYLKSESNSVASPSKPLSAARTSTAATAARVDKSQSIVSRKPDQRNEHSRHSPARDVRARDSPNIAKRREEVDHGLGESIWDILNPGKKRAQYLARDIDSDEDMEANAEDIRREEQRAARAARLEDEREAKALREAEERKAKKRKRLDS